MSSCKAREDSRVWDQDINNSLGQVKKTLTCTSWNKLFFKAQSCESLRSPWEKELKTPFTNLEKYQCNLPSVFSYKREKITCKTLKSQAYDMSVHEIQMYITSSCYGSHNLRKFHLLYEIPKNMKGIKEKLFCRDNYATPRAKEIHRDPSKHTHREKILLHI